MHTDFLSSNAQHHQQTPVGSLLIAIGVLILATGCTQAAGLHEHEAYRGFPDSRSKVLCSTGGSESPTRILCTEPLDASPQDGHLENSRPEYTVEGNDVVDSITGLAWRKQTTSVQNYGAAKDVCSGFDGDYRLPSRLELISLIDYGGTDLLIDKNVFQDVQQLRYFTSTIYQSIDPQYDDTHWRVSFTGVEVESDGQTILPGETIERSDTNAGGVICVRRDSGPYVSGPFEPAGVKNQFLRDARTGLLWLTKPLEAASWNDAVARCSTVLDGGYGDFRLPNAKEIATLIDDSRPAADKSRNFAIFNFAHSPMLWSSTPTPDASFAFALDTSGGSIRGYETNIGYHSILCVRGPD